MGLGCMLKKLLLGLVFGATFMSIGLQAAHADYWYWHNGHRYHAHHRTWHRHWVYDRWGHRVDRGWYVYW